jgi:hypothetical protein
MGMEKFHIKIGVNFVTFVLRWNSLLTLLGQVFHLLQDDERSSSHIVLQQVLMARQERFDRVHDDTIELTTARGDGNVVAIVDGAKVTLKVNFSFGSVQKLFIELMAHPEKSTANIQNSKTFIAKYVHAKFQLSSFYPEFQNFPENSSANYKKLQI